MDYKKMYKEALERARQALDKIQPEEQGVIRLIKDAFPELAESEDERMVKAITHVLYENYTDAAVIEGVEIAEIVTWLEKQKEKPSDAKLERVIKASRSVLNNWLDGTDCPDVSGDFAELEYAIREYDGEEKQKECVADSSKTSADDDERIRKAALEGIEYLEHNLGWDAIGDTDILDVKEYIEKQKEPHYANKRVDDIMNMPELSAFEQALTNFIGYWEDDEEHWPSQFVKKHGKHILDMAREELQKEQKSEQYSPLCVTVKDKIHEYISNHFIADTVVKTDIKSIVKAMEEGVRLGKEEQKLVNSPAGFYVTLPDGKKYYTKEMRCNGMNVKVVEPKPAEWSEDKFPKDIEKDATQFCFDNGINITPHQAKQIAIHYLMVGHNEGYVEGRKNAHIPARELGLPSSMDFKQEWSEEDEEMLDAMIDIVSNSLYEPLCPREGMLAWLKSLRPSWKPSEEQIEALHTAVYLEEMQFYGGLKDKLRDLYEQLKKL